ncbi:MAG: ABC transporter permease [Candidatus Eisenbacteria bacterium]|nr:ABC transporter permease [Candidatus Eisenbacteria bacterium]
MTRPAFLRPVAHLVRKEFLQVFRDPALLRMILLLPVVQLFVFGYAANTDLKNVRLSVLDESRSRESRRLVEAFYQSSVFIPGPEPSRPDEIEKLLAEGKAEIGIRIPAGYARDLDEGKQAIVGVLVDGVNSSSAGRAQGYAEQILLREAARVAEADRGSAAPVEGRSRIEGETRFFYNPELESRYYMVPGIVVLIITIISSMLTGVAVVRERETGTLEQLLVSPLSPAQLIAGKTIPFAILAFADLAFAATIAVLWFRIPLEGSVLLLAFVALLFLLVTLGGGLLASTVSATQQQAMFTLWFFLVFGILLSGFFYPIENMPRAIQYLTYLNPLRYMMSMVRGIFLRGAALPDVWPDLWRLSLIGIAMFSLAVLRFRKRAR